MGLEECHAIVVFAPSVVAVEIELFIPVPQEGKERLGQRLVDLITAIAV